MPELRARKPSATKAAPAVKAPSKRKASATDYSPQTAPKKIKGEVKAKKEKKSIPVTEEEPEDDGDEQDQVSDADDDEAKALARIVDSDVEEEDAGNDEEAQTLELPKGAKDLVKSSKTDGTEPGVVYVGRIPRGFFEHQMREYFSQFGTVNKVRMSRNKATGQSKHFAFIEFAELEVAEIVAKTMDNYLLAGHILKVKMVPKSQIHEKLWVGANKRFKKIPWNKMAGNMLKKPLSESGWAKKITKEEKKREERAKKLKALGYEFEGPKIKTIEDVKENGGALAAPSDEAPKAIEALPSPEDNALAEQEEEALVVKKASKAAMEPTTKPGKKGKKAKKSK
ncbi:RNA-binding domain-containing protein [Xylariaceae sp. FL0255]|nr:RNA-binding domain-containing protein [Xylariaceae sp. FL0255]